MTPLTTRMCGARRTARERVLEVCLGIMAAACGACGARTFAGRSPDATPGLPADGERAVMFAPGVVSTGDVFASTFTPDGRTVVFTKFSPPRMTLMTSSLAN